MDILETFRLLFLISIAAALGEWDYELMSMTVDSKTPDNFLTFTKAARVARGTYGLSANFTSKVPLDNSVILEVKVLRSSNGNNQYSLHPFRVPPTGFVDVMNTFYKRYVMDSFKGISNFPVFEDKYEGPLEPGFYYLNNAIFKKDTFPKYLQTGHYKIEISVKSKDLDVTYTMICRIFQ